MELIQAHLSLEVKFLCHNFLMKLLARDFCKSDSLKSMQIPTL